jgi:hypothetical protein
MTGFPLCFNWQRTQGTQRGRNKEDRRHKRNSFSVHCSPLTVDQGDSLKKIGETEVEAEVSIAADLRPV